MAGLRLIVTGLALANFRKAKAEYEAAQKAFNIECAALTFEINRYNSEKYKELEEYNQKALNPDTGLLYNQNDTIANVEMIPILRIYRVGFGILPIPDYYSQRPVVYVNNQTDREITIHAIGGSIMSYHSLAAKLGDISNSKVEFKIAPHEIAELCLTYEGTEFGKDLVKFNNTLTGKEYEKSLMNALYNAGGVTKTSKRGRTTQYITPGTIIQSSKRLINGNDWSPCVMDLEMEYSDNKDKNVRRALYKEIQGSIVYVG